MFASPTGTCPLVELPYNHWVGILERFDVSNTGVRHVALNSSAVEVFSCSTSPAHSFIIRTFAVAEEEVVHRSLTAGHELEGLQDEVDHFL